MWIPTIEFVECFGHKVDQHATGFAIAFPGRQCHHVGQWTFGFLESAASAA